MITVILALSETDFRKVVLPPQKYQLDVAAWMGMKRIREKDEKLPRFEGLDVYLNDAYVKTDDSEQFIERDQNAVIILRPRAIKDLPAEERRKPATNQFFLIE